MLAVLDTFNLLLHISRVYARGDSPRTTYFNRKSKDSNLSCLQRN